MPLFGPPNVKKLRAKRDVQGLINALGYKKDYRVCRDAAVALGEIQDQRAVEPLIAATDTGNREVRKAAAGALVRVPDPRAIMSLIALLEDTFDKYGHVIDDTLGKSIRDAIAEIGTPAVEPLIAALKYRNTGTQKAAAEELGRIRDPRAVEPLIAFLEKDRKAAVEALVEIGEPAVEPLIAALKDKDNDVRKGAVEALDKLGWQPGEDATAVRYWIAAGKAWHCKEIGEPAVGPLIEALGSWEDRTSAASVLGTIGDPRAVEPLSKWLFFHNATESQCNTIAKALVQFGAPGVETLIAATSQASNLKAHTAARDALELIDDPSAVDQLVAALGNRNDTGKQYFIEALGRIDGVGNIDLLVEALEDKKEFVQWSAARVLGGIRDNRSARALTKALMDGGRLSLEAAQALGRIGTQEAVDGLLKGLKHEDSHVREISATVLGSIDNDRAKAALISSVENDSSDEVRAKAVEALGDVDNEQAMQVLFSALKDESIIVRTNAVKALGRICNPDAVAPIIELLKEEFADKLWEKYMKAGQISKAYRMKQACLAAAVVLGELRDPAAVPALVEALKDEWGEVRKAAGTALVSIYRSGNLNENQKQAILSLRTNIMVQHEDNLETCAYSENHEDYGIGVQFPI
jgi:HEAT repeat protein